MYALCADTKTTQLSNEVAEDVCVNRDESVSSVVQRRVALTDSSHSHSPS